MSKFHNQLNNWQIVGIVAVLLMIAASRIMLIGDLMVSRDEVWTAIQGSGSLGDVLRWRPFDWPPLYYIIIFFWQALVGITPVALRYFSVLVALLGIVILYRVLSRWAGYKAGILGMLTYGAMASSIYRSTEARGYALAVTLLLLCLWLTIRYFDDPTVKCGSALAVALIVTLSTTLTTVLAFVMLGIVTLIIYGWRQIWRWWLPVLIFIGPAMGILLSVEGSGRVVGRSLRNLQIVNLFVGMLPRLYSQFVGKDWSVFWLIVVIGVGLLLLGQRRLWQREVLAVLVWWLGGGVLLYVSDDFLGLFSLRYGWWLGIGLALWIGWGLSYIPRQGWLGAVGLLIFLMFSTGDSIQTYYRRDTGGQLSHQFELIAAEAQAGDVIAVDSGSCQVAWASEWEYLTRLYLARGPQFVEEPTTYHRRVWYFHDVENRDETLYEAVQEGRVPGVFVGPPECLARLWEGPPDPAGILFENGMRFHGAEILNSQDGPYPVAHEGESLRLRFWWSADEAIDRDYSVGLYLFNEAGQLLVQSDGPPQVIDGPQETSQWQGDSTFYIEEREIVTPYPFMRDWLKLTMAVYHWQDDGRVVAPGVDENTHLFLDDVYIASW